MKKINFALVSDTFFFTVCAFVISFTALRYFFKSAITALIISVGIAATVCFVTLFLLISGRRAKLFKSYNEREKKSLGLHLSVSSQNYILDLFKKALDGTYTVGNHVEDKDFAYYFNFKLSPLTADDIARVIKGKGEKSKKIFCCLASAEASSLAEDFNVKTVDIAEVYMLLKEKNLLPEKYALGEVKRTGFFKKIKKCFNRKLCAPLFFSGLFLLFYSYFTFYPLLYIIFGGVLTILSAVCLFVPQKG